MFGLLARIMFLKLVSPTKLLTLVALQVMESLGVLDELREAGAKEGDIVLVGDMEIALTEPPENLG